MRITGCVASLRCPCIVCERARASVCVVQPNDVLCVFLLGAKHIFHRSRDQRRNNSQPPSPPSPSAPPHASPPSPPPVLLSSCHPAILPLPWQTTQLGLLTLNINIVIETQLYKAAQNALKQRKLSAMLHKSVCVSVQGSVCVVSLQRSLFLLRRC